jgi:hypothetical protein
MVAMAALILFPICVVVLVHFGITIVIFVVVFQPAEIAVDPNVFHGIA